MARRSDDPRQGILFEATAAGAGSLNFDRELRAAMRQAISQCDKSRELIAEEMEELLGSDPEYPISKSLLDAWTAPSRTDWRFPLIYLPVFIRVTGATWLLDRIAQLCGRVVVDGDQAELLELGRLDDESARLAQRKRELLAKRRGRR